MKSIHIIIIALVWAVIGLVLISKIENQPLTFSDFVNDILGLLPVGWINHLWYLGALVCIYVFFPLLKNAYDNNLRIFMYFTCLCMIFTFGNTFLRELFTLFANTFFHTGKVFYDTNFFLNFNPFRGVYHNYSLVYFCLGGLAYRYKDNILKYSVRVRNLASAICILVNLTLLFFMGYEFSKIECSPWNTIWYGYDSLFALMIVCSIYVLSLSYQKNIKLLSLISSNTLGIYLMHFIFIRLTDNYINSLGFFSNFIGNIIYSVIILFIGLGVTLIFRKIPLIRLLFQL